MTPSVQIFIRSYEKDFEWLGYCLRSIAKFAIDFEKIVVVVPKGQTPPTGTNEVVFEVEETFGGYFHQQNSKLHADYFTGSEFILFMDSDCIFTRHITPQDVITEDYRVKWLYTAYSELGPEASNIWRPVVERAMECKVDYEFMRRHPFCVPQWALGGLREWFWQNHGMSVESYIQRQPGNEFSEWNILGAWMWTFHRDHVEWINTITDTTPPFVHQAHSWSGFNPELRANFEDALR